MPSISKNKWLKPFALTVVIAVLGLLMATYLLQAGGDGNDAREALFKAKRGPLTISVVESGTVKPSDQVIIKNELEGRSTILWLIEEGAHVEAGDLLVELDASELLDNKVDQEIKVQNAESDLVESRESLAVVQNQAKSDTEQAELDLRFAKEDLGQYLEGEYPNTLKELEGKITLAEEELERAADKLKWSQKLFAEKYISQTELRADELAAHKAELDLELAKSDLDLLKTYTHQRQLDQLTSDVRQAEMALERTRRKASADVVQAEARLRAREAEYNRQKDKLDKIGEQIAKAKITAPADGLVVYATSAEFSWRGDTEPLDEGQEVRERQELIHLPTADTFVAQIKIHEASLKKIYLGLPVLITLDALPGTSFGGKVSRIAPLPDARSMFMNPDLKVYDAEVDIDGGGDALKTGMSCQVEIVIAQYDDALHVPIQCVVRIGGRPTVYVDKRGREPEPREVEIGLDNNVMVHILSGLETGEKVLLAPPLDRSGVDTSVTQTEKLDIPERPAPRSNGNNVDRTGTPRASGGPEQPAGDGDREPNRQRPRNSESGAEDRPRTRPDFENMTPEQREALRAKWQQRRERRERE